MITRLLLILLVTVKAAAAQPVANNPFIPNPGQLYSIGTCNFKLKEVDVKGENLAWDFSRVLSPKYSQTAYGTDKDPYFSPHFSSANFSVVKYGLTEGDSGYSYYYFGPDSFAYYGYATIHPNYLMRAPYPDPNVHIKYPVKYKDSFTDYGYFEFIGFDRGAADSQLCISLYTNTVVVDGWGTMKFNTRTFDSVLKVKVNTMHVRRWFWDMGTIVYRNDTSFETSYYFISNEFKGPILKGIQSGADWVSFSFQNDIFLGTPKPESQPSSIYPNPATQNITVSLPATSYSITDLLGKEITKTAITGPAINVQNLSTGIYFLHLYDGEKYLGCEKFCKE